MSRASAATGDFALLQYAINPWPRGHQFSDSGLEDLLIALVGLCNGLIVFIGREPGNCRFTVFELANQQDIPYGKSWELVRCIGSLTVALLWHGT
jgi:hypothetical protein